jgi:hypothetical protein
MIRLLGWIKAHRRGLKCEEAGIESGNSWHLGAPKESPTTGGSWAKYTIKGEINETKPTILYYIYLH